MSKHPERYFWDHVSKTDSCWNWIGYIGPYGYGAFYDVTGQTIAAHRFSWKLHFGPIPDSLWVLHHCDNRACVRPDHLFLGTREDNTNDMVNKHRQAHNYHMRGVGNTHHKLTDENVREIRLRYAKGGISINRLGREYGVHKGTISKLILRLTWKHIL